MLTWLASWRPLLQAGGCASFGTLLWKLMHSRRLLTDRVACRFGVSVPPSWFYQLCGRCPCPCLSGPAGALDSQLARQRWAPIIRLAAHFGWPTAWGGQMVRGRNYVHSMVEMLDACREAGAPAFKEAGVGAEAGGDAGGVHCKLWL